jgi:hypothetical protein
MIKFKKGGKILLELTVGNTGNDGLFWGSYPSTYHGVVTGDPKVLYLHQNNPGIVGYKPPPQDA